MTPDQLIAAFDVLAEAPNGIQRLRELVLSLAVRGKLVPQDPNDEPAGLLLERIAEEKERLVRAKTIPRPKALPDLPSELPFAAPNGWAWTRIAHLVAHDLTDGDWVESKDQDPSGAVRLTQLADVGIDTFLDKSDRYLTSETAARLNCTFLEPGDVLIARLPRPLGRACVFPGLSQPAVTVVDVAVARCSAPSVYNRYLVTLMNSPFVSAQVEQLAAGTTRKRISTGNLRRITVPIPPLSEQRRIVTRVDELMALLDRLETARNARESSRAAARDSALAALREAETPDDVELAWQRIAERMDDLFTDPADVAPLRQAILELAVRGRLVPQDPNDEPATLLLDGIIRKKAQLVLAVEARQQKPLAPIATEEVRFTIPPNWAWVRIDDCFHVVGGIQKSGKRRPQYHPAPYLRVANVQRGYLDLTEIAEFELFEGELERYKLRPGDLLVVEGNGSESEIGRCARWSGEIEHCVHQNHLIRCRPAQSGQEHFVLLYLNSPSGIETMKALAVTTSGLYNLSVGKIRNIAIPLPPLAEQHRIVAKVDELMAMLDRLEQRLAATVQAQGAFAAAAVHHLHVAQIEADSAVVSVTGRSTGNCESRERGHEFSQKHPLEMESA